VPVGTGLSWRCAVWLWSCSRPANTPGGPAVLLRSVLSAAGRNATARLAVWVSKDMMVAADVE
jgi:hypothetical protein